MNPEKKPRETGSMDTETRKRVSAAGGKKILETRGREYFIEMGRRGGQKISQDRDHMARIGRVGGNAQKGKSDANS